MPAKREFVAFALDEGKVVSASIFEGKPLPGDYKWGELLRCESHDQIVWVFWRGEKPDLAVIHHLLSQWAAGKGRNVLGRG